MNKRKKVTQSDYDAVKTLAQHGISLKEIGSLSHLGQTTIWKIRNSADYAEFQAKNTQDWRKRQSRRAEQTTHQIKADTQDPVPHESLNRDMLKAINQSIQVLAENQSIIISKMDELIKKWE